MDGERRAVLRGIAGLTGIAVGSGVGGASRVGTASGANGADAGIRAREPVRRQVDTELQSGVTLFDLDGDGEYAATVERASETMRDDDHPRPIHVTSGGRSTVDYAVSVAEPPAGTTLGGLDRLSYDYYEGADETASGVSDAETDGGGGGDGEADGGADPGSPPGDPFLVVENDDGRHGASLGSAGAGDAGTGDAGDADAGTADTGDADMGADSAAEQWSTFDVLARMTGDAAGESRWFEYTTVEDGYDGESFDDVTARFGGEATLALVGVGYGNAVTPTTLDAYFDNLVVGEETLRFPASVVNRVS